MARDVRTGRAAAERASRRRFLRGARARRWRVASRPRAAAASGRVARSRSATGRCSGSRASRCPGCPIRARRRCAAWPGRSSAAPACRPRPTRPSCGSPIPTCSATRSWCCRAIARFALPPEADIARLRRHITYGGFLLIDSAEGRAGGGFDESVRRLLAQTLPGELPIRIPDEPRAVEVVLRAARRAGPDHRGAVRSKGSSAIAGWPSSTRRTISGGALARDGFGRWEHEVIPGGDDQREEAFRLGVNLVMYALCLDYKTEQAHIDYILRTRRLPR